MIKALIIDDENLARERIRDLLSGHNDKLTIVGEADCGQKGIDQISAEEPDLLFLDIQMPDMTGFEMLSKLDYQPKIIFTTAYAEHAIKAFENLVVDYLVKPISQQRMDKAMEKLSKFQATDQQIDLKKLEALLTNTPKQKENDSLAVKKGNRIILVDYEDICYLKAEAKYVNICLSNGIVHLTDKSLQELESKLSSDFIRIHRSYIVNKRYVSEIEKYFKGTLILHLNDKDHTKLKSSEKYSKDLKVKLGLL